MVTVQCSIVVCYRWWRFAQSFVKDVALKAHPKMTNDNEYNNDHFFAGVE
jgi:hypothetical protein